MPERTQEQREATDPLHDRASEERCDYCGAAALTWRKCKLVCGNCANIVKSCADL
jgi:hypothetical protein